MNPIINRITHVVFAIVILGMFVCTAVATDKADYVFKNGAIYTIDSKNPTAQAIAVTGKTISYVGTNAGVQPFIGDKTQVVDLHGQMLLPGFVDSHIHPTLAMFAGGADLQYDTVGEVLASVKKWADAHPDAKVIRGFGWRYTLFPTTGPTKADLDKLFPNRPVLLIAIDVHSAWVNSKALELAGVNANTPDPVPGFSYFQREPKTGEPTGWVVETAAEQAVLAKLTPPTPEAQIAETAELLPKFSAAGITAVFDAGISTLPTESGLDGYQNLEKEDKLPVRVVGTYYWNNPATEDPAGIALKLRDKYHSELVQFRALKINADGGEAQHTAVLLKPYFDRPGFYGDYLLDPKLMEAAVLKAQANGLDTHCHCYGDAAIRTYLDIVAEAEKQYPNSPSRHTIAHSLLITDQDVPRFKELNVTMQTSPQWITPDPYSEKVTQILGNEVVNTEWARMNSVSKAGGRLAFGTDWPAAGYFSSYRPLDAIQVALTRAILPQYEKIQFTPIMPPANERITLDQALRAYTLDSAYVLDLEKQIGSLEVGKLADIVVLEKDLYKIPPADISTTKVELTMMNGHVTYRAK
ncbi:MAG: amidohydrolase [Candidatus Korobacteraceae bacterium]